MQEFIVTTSIKKMLRLKQRTRIIQGGSSSGKTFGILPILIDVAIKNPGKEISIVSESVPHLRRGAMKDFVKILHMTGRFTPSQWNKTLMKYTFGNGSYIEFFSVEDESKLRGARRNILYANEANNISYSAFQQLAIRTDETLWVDYNPSSRFWAHSELIGQPNTDFLITTYKDNESLPQSIIDELETYRDKGKTSTFYANLWQVYGLGQLGTLEGACLSEWKPIDKLPDGIRLLNLGIDFGYTNDPTTIIAMYKWNDAYIYDELAYETGMLNSHIASRIKSFGFQNPTIYADSAEPKSIAQIRLEGLNIFPTRKGRDSIVNGIALINQQEVYITSSSKNLIMELQNYTWKVDKENNKLNIPVDKYNHAIDAMRYSTTMELENPNKGEYHFW